VKSGHDIHCGKTEVRCHCALCLSQSVDNPLDLRQHEDHSAAFRLRSANCGPSGRSVDVTRGPRSPRAPVAAAAPQLRQDGARWRRPKAHAQPRVTTALIESAQAREETDSGPPTNSQKDAEMSRTDRRQGGTEGSVRTHTKRFASVVSLLVEFQ
jgi:hypothetical protein